METNDGAFFIVRSGPPVEAMAKALLDVIAGEETTLQGFVIASINGESVEMCDACIVGLCCGYPSAPNTHGGAEYVIVSGRCKVAFDSTKPPEERSFEMCYDVCERKGNIKFTS